MVEIISENLVDSSPDSATTVVRKKAEMDQNKYLVLGDLHCRVEKAEALIYSANYQDDLSRVILLGDFVDPYDYEDELGLTATPEETLEWVASFMAKGGIACIGNHDAHYLFPRNLCLSGSRYDSTMTGNPFWSPEKNPLISKSMYFWLNLGNGVLLSHAGFSNTTADGLDLAKSLSVGDTTDQATIRKLCAVGTSRGGDHMEGGPLWRDWGIETPMAEGFRQIVGHTRVRKPVIAQMAGRTKYSKYLRRYEVKDPTITTLPFIAESLFTRCAINIDTELNYALEVTIKENGDVKTEIIEAE
jgi:hypothetical protein